MTNHADNRIPFPKPENYDPYTYELLLRSLQTGRKDFFEKFDDIPNRKTDTNNHGPFSFDNLGMNYDYPDGDYARRAEIIKEHEDYQKGLMYFLAMALQLDVVELQVPVHEVFHALLDRCGRLVTDVLAQVLGVGPGVGHVAGLQGKQVFYCLAAEAFLQHFDITHQLHRLMIADVVEPIRRGAGGRVRILAVPGRVRLCRSVQHADDALNDVVDVGERIRPGRPVVSLLVDADDPQQAETKLQRLAAQLRLLLRASGEFEVYSTNEFLLQR